MGLLLLICRNGAAQTSTVAPEWAPRRWTAGVQLAAYPRIALAEAADGRGGTEYVRPWPVLLTVAYRTKQRASFEVGLLLRAEPTRTISTTNSSGTYTSRKRAVSWAVPVVTRAHLPLPNPGRWQVDFEVGVMPLSARYSDETTFTDAQTGQTSTSSGSRDSYSDVQFIGGFGGAYALTPNLSLTADAHVTFSVLLAIVGQALSNYGVKNDIVPFAPALSTGVSYRFGKTLLRGARAHFMPRRCRPPRTACGRAGRSSRLRCAAVLRGCRFP